MSGWGFRVRGLRPLAWADITLAPGRADSFYASPVLRCSSRVLVLPPCPLLLCDFRVGTQCMALGTGNGGVNLWRGLDWHVPREPIEVGVGTCLVLRNPTERPVTLCGVTLWVWLFPDALRHVGG